MGIRFDCDFSQEEFDRDKLGKEIFQAEILVRNKASSDGFDKVGDMHVSKEEVPEKIKSQIGALGDKSWAEMEVLVSGDMIPQETGGNLSYYYTNDEPEILSINLVVITVVPNGKDLARTHNYSPNQIEDFAGEVEEILSERIKYKNPSKEKENTPDNSRGFR